ncbi:MAG TPA: 50S ribosomal protein L44e [Candidatus Nanoarchaeia archaeon]|nr:50S ribosomal protein L44e [Candidatus Nanoarchaeia archaeon]
MKLPQKVTRYCPYCKKHTSQTIAAAKQKGRSSAHPMSRWSRSRAKLRGQGVGYGNLGRFSKPPIKSWKRKSKSTKRLGILYTCTICKKSKGIKKSIRTSRLEIGEKIAK